MFTKQKLFRFLFERNTNFKISHKHLSAFSAFYVFLSHVFLLCKRVRNDMIMIYTFFSVLHRITFMVTIILFNISGTVPREAEFFGQPCQILGSAGKVNLTLGIIHVLCSVLIIGKEHCCPLWKIILTLFIFDTFVYYGCNIDFLW